MLRQTIASYARHSALVCTASVMLALSLACGGVAPGPALLGSPPAGPFATAMGELFEAEHPGIPCPSVPVGEEIVVGDFTLRFEEAILFEPETQLPWVRTQDERRAFSREGAKALAVVYSLKNNTPMARPWDLSLTVYSADGNHAGWWAYQENLAREVLSIQGLGGTVPPGEWIRDVGVVLTKEGVVDGSALRFYLVERELDPSDPYGRRRIDVLKSQGILDTGAATPGGHINPAKRGA